MMRLLFFDNILFFLLSFFFFFCEFCLLCHFHLLRFREHPQELQENRHDDRKKIELTGTFIECDKQVVSFNQGEGDNKLLKLGTAYHADFTLTNISGKALKLDLFVRGCAEPHEVVFEPAHVALPPNGSKRVGVSVKFRCTANLSPERVEVCGEVERTAAWGPICGVEADTDLTRIISCDDLTIHPRRIGAGR